MIPYVQWLKRIDEADKSSKVAKSHNSKSFIINVGKYRFQSIPKENDDENKRIKIQEDPIKDENGLFINRLTFNTTQMGDSGMYVCFVTNSGHDGVLSYKSAFLHVKSAENETTLSDFIPTMIYNQKPFRYSYKPTYICILL